MTALSISSPTLVKPIERITSVKRKEGLGIFAQLDDDDLIELLEYMGANELRCLSQLSKIFYMFTSHEELV